MGNFDAGQMLLIGVVASIVAQGVKMYAAWRGVEIGRKGMTLTVFGAAVFLAYVFARPVVPAFPLPVEDPAVYATLVGAWLVSIAQMAAGLLGAAFTVYNLLLEKVFEKMNIGSGKKQDLITAKSPQRFGGEFGG